MKQLEKQFPLHDVEPDKCHQLSPGELDKMTSYLDNVKRNVAGQGVVSQLGRSSPSPPPVMPPPMPLLPCARQERVSLGTAPESHSLLSQKMGFSFSGLSWRLQKIRMKNV